MGKEKEGVEITIYFLIPDRGLRAMHVKPFVRDYEEGKKVARVYKYGNKNNPPYTNCKGYIVKRYI